LNLNCHCEGVVATEAISAMLLDCFASLAMTKVSELGISNLGTKSLRRFNTMLNIIRKKSIRTMHFPLKERRALIDFKTKLEERLGDQVKEIRLFGSKARGDWHKGSDIDILIILSRLADKNQAKDIVYSLVLSICEKFGLYLSVKVFSESEFKYYKSIPTLFVKNIMQESILL